MSMFEKRIEMLEEIASHWSISRSEFEDKFNISQPQANVIIREFIKLGFLEKYGDRYRATEKTKRIFK